MRSFFLRLSAPAGPLVALALIFVLGASPPARAEGFLSTLTDMPLAAGLVEIADGALVFDKPEGRIVHVTALRDATSSPASISAFYRRTLPNLGWQMGQAQSHSLTFARKGETLRITVSGDLVIFDLTPAR